MGRSEWLKTYAADMVRKCGFFFGFWRGEIYKLCLLLIYVAVSERTVVMEE